MLFAFKNFCDTLFDNVIMILPFHKKNWKETHLYLSLIKKNKGATTHKQMNICWIVILTNEKNKSSKQSFPVYIYLSFTFISLTSDILYLIDFLLECKITFFWQFIDALIVYIEVLICIRLSSNF